MRTKLYLRTIVKTVLCAIMLSGASLMPVTTDAQIKNIVLVHGAFADGSGYEGLYKILTNKGYHVTVVGSPNTGLADDVAAVKRTLDRVGGPVLLVGHSYGGAVITEAGSDPRVAGLVYIDAFVPDAGETLAKLAAASPAPNSGVLPPSKDGFVWYDKAKFHSGFCADLPKEKADFLYASQVPVAASVFGATIAHPAWKTKPSWYVLGTADQTIPAETQRMMAKRANAKITEVKGASHLVFISQPATVAQVVEMAAKSSNPITKR